jgi:hypothetical protein
MDARTIVMRITTTTMSNVTSSLQEKNTASSLIHLS